MSTNTISAPSPVDCQILQFKQLFKLRTCYDTSKNVYKNPTQLVAISNLFGLTFVGENAGIKVIVSNKIFEDDNQNFNPKYLISNYVHQNIPLPSPPTHIGVNCDQTLLSVTFCKDEIPVLRIYQIETFFLLNTVIINEVRLSSTNGTFVTDFCWNPTIAHVLCCCISDGTLFVYTFRGNNFEVKSLPTESNSICACWSPKGKQIVVGNYHGYLTQYLPELKPVKNFPPPTGIFDKPCALRNIKWLSSFQFIGVYKLQEQYATDCEEKTSIVVINTPKNGPVTYVNYDDICFSSGTDRPCQFYFIHVAAWNLIFIASANAVEVAVLSLNQDSNMWFQWNLDCSVRITLPMCNVDETFPVGIDIDFSSPIKTAIGENLVSMPVLTILTCKGLLCVYLINYLDPSAPCICVKTNPVPTLERFTSDIVTHDIKEENKTTNSAVVSNCNRYNNVESLPNLISNCLTEGNVETHPRFIPNMEDLHVPTTKQNMSVHLSDTNLLRNASFVNNNNTRLEVKPMGTMTTHINSGISNLKPEYELPPKPVTDPPDNSTDTSSTACVSNVPKPIERAKTRNETLKKFKKAASVFENDIQEIKYLINNIEIQDKDFLGHASLYKLENNTKKLKALNTVLRNEIDLIKISVIEAFACIMNVKTKYFQLVNPGYQSLLDFQDLDPVNTTQLKNIENGVNYVWSQIEKADKQLDEVWFKFNENSPTPTTKIPILDNIFKTIDKQHKILHVLEFRTEKLQKRAERLHNRMAFMKYSVTDRQQLITEKQFSYGPTENTSILSDDDSSLANLTTKFLNLNAVASDRVDARKLVHVCSIEYAKRFHLSHTKQVRLQELHSSGSITFIQSNRLQRLKKKSLIILSKTSCAAEEISERNEPNVQPLTEELQVAMISPVSYEECGTDSHINAYESVIGQGVASSTPLKNNLILKFNVEKTYETEILPVTSAFTPRTQIMSRASVTSSFPSSPADVRILQTETESKIIDAEIKTSISSSLIAYHNSNSSMNVPGIANVIQSAPEKVSSVFAQTSPFSGVFQTVSCTSTMVTASNSLVESEKIPLSVSSTGANMTSFFGNIKQATASLPNANVNFSKSAFTNACTTSSVPLNTTNVATCSTSSNVTASFSFNIPKNDVAAAKTVIVPTSSTVSIFSGKISTPITTTLGMPIASSESVVTSLFKNISNSSGLSIFGNPTGVAAAISTSCGTNASVATATSQPAANITERKILLSIPFPKDSGITISPVTSSDASSSEPSPFSNTSSIFGKPSTSVSSTINFGSVLSPTNSIFGMKVPVTSVTLNEKKSDTFNAFSFVSKPTENTVTISEISSEISSRKSAVESNKENTTANANPSATTTFSFAAINSPSKFSPARSEAYATTISTPAMASVSCAPAILPDSNDNSVLFNTVTATTPSITAITSNNNSVFTTITTMVSSSAPVIAPSVSIPVTLTQTSITTLTTATATAPQTIGASSIIENTTGSFFGNLTISSASTTTNTALIFGKPVSTSAPIFGSGVNIFSQNTSTNGIPATSSDSKTVFGSSSSSAFLFGQNNSTSTEKKSIFGNFQSGGQPSVFGSSSLFGTSGSGFGNSATPVTHTSTFSSNSSGTSFGNSSGSFGSSPTTSFQNTNNEFGQQNKNTSGFGSPPSFPSVFSKAPSSFPAFGGGPTFGGSPTFGNSPTKVFGQTSTNLSTFGNPTQQPTAFENLASENTMSFGNLAQQHPAGFGSPSFGSSTNTPPSFGSSFGGNSFSSWR